MSFCLLCRQQSAQIWILAIRIWFSNCQSPSIQTQQLIAKSNLLQNPTYFTLLEVIYLLSKVQIKYQDASIIVLAVDVLDQSLCVAERPYTKWALSSLSFQNSMKYGMKEEQLISYTAWHTACVDFFTNVLTIDEQQLFQCKNCGPRPSVLVFDGIAMGIMKSELNRCKSVMEKDLGYKSNVVIAGSNFEERMFIKLAKNRKLLRESAKKGIWPSTKESNAGSSESELEFEPGQKRKREYSDEGMDIFLKFTKKLDRSKSPNKGILLLMENLSSSTSTVGLMQKFDPVLTEKIIHFLKGNMSYNFVSGIENTNLHLEVRNRYPIFMDILLALSDCQGALGKHER